MIQCAWWLHCWGYFSLRRNWLETSHWCSSHCMIVWCQSDIVCPLFFHWNSTVISSETWIICRPDGKNTTKQQNWSHNMGSTASSNFLTVLTFKKKTLPRHLCAFALHSALLSQNENFPNLTLCLAYCQWSTSWITVASSQNTHYAPTICPKKLPPALLQPLQTFPSLLSYVLSVGCP